MLTDGAHPQAPAGVEERHLEEDDEAEREVGEDVLVEDDRAEDRDLVEQGHGDVGEGRGTVERRLVVVEHLGGEEVGQPGREGDDDDTDDDLVGLVAEHEEGEDRAHQRAREGGAGDAQPDRARGGGDHRAEEGAGEELALDRDVDHPRAFAHDPGHRAEHERNRVGEGELEHAGEVERRPRAAQMMNASANAVSPMLSRP